LRFAGRIHRDELLRFMSEQGDALLFPSIHDEAGWVVAEARACGLPVICLDRGGPPLLGGTAVRVTSMRSTARALAAALPEAGGPAAPPVNSFALAVRSIALRAVLADHGIVASEPADGERHALVVDRMGSRSR
jgi:glycosyltransferase involved in cell wall biosynthesis